MRIPWYLNCSNFDVHVKKWNKIELKKFIKESIHNQRFIDIVNKIWTPGYSEALIYKKSEMNFAQRKRMPSFDQKIKQFGFFQPWVWRTAILYVHWAYRLFLAGNGARFHYLLDLKPTYARLKTLIRIQILIFNFFYI